MDDTVRRTRTSSLDLSDGDARFSLTETFCGKTGKFLSLYLHFNRTTFDGLISSYSLHCKKDLIALANHLLAIAEDIQETEIEAETKKRKSFYEKLFGVKR